MTRHPACATILVGVFFLSLMSGPFPVPALADETDPARRTAMESAKTEAAALLKRGRASDACELYLRLLREAPEDDDVNLGLARAASQAGRWNQAVMAYERLLEKYPREAPLYAELARAYMALNDKASAEHALASLRRLDPSATRDVTDTLLEKLEDRYGLFQAHGRARFGMLYDSNANQGPESNSLDLGGWRVNMHNAKAAESLGVYLGADIDLGLKCERDSPWWLVGDVQTSIRYNTNNDLDNAHSRESQWGRTATGLRRLDSDTLLDIRLKAEIFDYELYQHVSALGGEAVWLWAATPALQLISRGGIDRRIYSRDPDRNGAYYNAGQYLRFFFGESNHYSLMLGARYTGASANDKDYGYDGWEGSARLTFNLPHSLEFAPFAAFSQEFYNGPATALEMERRRDDKRRMGASLTWRLTESWSVETVYQCVKNDSRSALYDYAQHMVSAGVAWSF
ncbi:MAG: tetratricopeptide repeat protein [Desulfovibrio sp.]|nr:tetratricopeptide repeat protein [Desulfovibrio sp.]